MSAADQARSGGVTSPRRRAERLLVGRRVPVAECRLVARDNLAADIVAFRLAPKAATAS